MESKDPVPTTDIEMSNFEKGGHTTLSTKTDDPPLKEASGLGLLANEDWILSLGSANAHNLDHIHAFLIEMLATLYAIIYLAVP